MALPRLESLKIRAKLLQKAKQKTDKSFALKDAQALVAKSLGYKDWRELKDRIELSELLLAPQASAFWHVWYRSYDEAKAHLDKAGGYLLPFENDFFVCDHHYIEQLGLSTASSEVKKIGADWTKPADREAWHKILIQLKGSKHKS